MILPCIVIGILAGSIFGLGLLTAFR